MRIVSEITLVIGLAVATLAVVAFKQINNEKLVAAIQQGDAALGFAVVELFTSEGCWSCPPADDLIAKIQEGNSNSELYIMAFHVDYWDHQGWKDRFSKRQFTDRQKNYADWLKLHTIYTPQLIVNGKSQLVGSDEGSVLRAIRTALAETTAKPLSLATHIRDKTIHISYSGAEENKDSEVLLAIVQKHASSDVRAGENAGKQLAHVQIVRELRQLDLKADDEVTFRLPKDFQHGDWEVIGFVQNQINGEITQAAKTAL